jgi:hypothetical protein
MKKGSCNKFDHTYFEVPEFKARVQEAWGAPKANQDVQDVLEQA